MLNEKQGHVYLNSFPSQQSIQLHYIRGFRNIDSVHISDIFVNFVFQDYQLCMVNISFQICNYQSVF